MNWNKDKSLLLSRIAVIFFALLLLTLDLFCVRLSVFFIGIRQMPEQDITYLALTLYLCSIPGWLCLISLWQLLGAIRRGEVFTGENVRRMRHVSWCCAAASLITLVSSLYYLPFIIAAAAMAFMALIVRIVKNAFDQALSMKSELDLTI